MMMKCEPKRLTGKPWHKREYDIKMYLKEGEYEALNWN
jgi:hypothetical protein